MIAHGKLITLQKRQRTIRLSHHFFHGKPSNSLFHTENSSVSPGDIVQKETAIFKSLILDPVRCISDKLDYISQISSQHALDQSCLLMSWTITSKQLQKYSHLKIPECSNLELKLICFVSN